MRGPRWLKDELGLDLTGVPTCDLFRMKCKGGWAFYAVARGLKSSVLVNKADYGIALEVS